MVRLPLSAPAAAVRLAAVAVVAVCRLELRPPRLRGANVGATVAQEYWGRWSPAERWLEVFTEAEAGAPQVQPSELAAGRWTCGELPPAVLAAAANGMLDGEDDRLSRFVCERNLVGSAGYRVSISGATK